MKCTVCGCVNPAGQKFCQRCGNKLTITSEDYSKSDIADYRRKYFDEGEDDFSNGKKTRERSPRRESVKTYKPAETMKSQPSRPGRVYSEANRYPVYEENKKSFNINQSQTLSKMLTVILIVLAVAVTFNLGFIAAKSIDLHIYKAMLTDNTDGSENTTENEGGAELYEQVQPEQQP